MAITVWKFPIETTGRQPQIVLMPEGAEILSVQAQRGLLNIWALVERSAKKTMRSIEVFDTGEFLPQDIGINRKFIGTCQLDGGDLVVHVFERTD